MSDTVDPDLDGGDIIAHSCPSVCSAVVVPVEVFVMVTTMAKEWLKDCPHRSSRIQGFVAMIQRANDCLRDGESTLEKIQSDYLQSIELADALGAKCAELESTLAMYRDAAETRPDRRPQNDELCGGGPHGGSDAR